MTNNYLDHLVSLLGKSSNDADLIDFFMSSGFIKNRNDLKFSVYDEYNLYINAYNEGLSFIFTDEAFF